MSDLLSRFSDSFIVDNRWQFFWSGFLMTMFLTLVAFLGGSLFGAIFCALRMSKKKAVTKITGIVIDFLVQLPTLVLLMFFVYIIFADVGVSVTLAVAFGLMLKCAAYMSDIFYTAVNGVNAGQTEAARTLGMSATQAFFHVTFPQALQSMIPLYQNQFVITLQETSLVGTLAVMDLTKASEVVTARTFDALFGLILISVMYLLIGFICTKLLALLRNNRHLGGESND